MVYVVFLMFYYFSTLVCANLVGRMLVALAVLNSCRSGRYSTAIVLLTGRAVIFKDAGLFDPILRDSAIFNSRHFALEISIKVCLC